MPKINVSKSIEINASVEKVFNIVNDYHSWQVWSPWLIQDPDCTVSVQPDGKSYEWEGERIGSGNMKTIKEVPNKSIDSDLLFLKPFKSKAKVNFTLEALSAEKTKLTWKMDSSLPFFMFWMKKKMEIFIGMDYDRGLLMLKDYVETGDVPTSLTFKGECSKKGCNYIGIKRTCSTSDISTKMKEDYERLMTYAPSEYTLGKAFSIYHEWDAITNKVEYTAALQVTEHKVPKSGFVSGSLEGGKAYALGHMGPYRHIGNAWATLYGMQQRKEIKVNTKLSPIEVYLNSPTEVSENELLTEIYFPLK